MNTFTCKFGKGKKKKWNDPSVLKINHVEGRVPVNTHTREVKSVETIVETVKTGYVRTTRKVKRDVKVVSAYTVQPEPDFHSDCVPTPGAKSLWH